MVAPGALPGTPGAVASQKREKRPVPITCGRTPAGGRRRLPRQSLTVVSYEGKVLGLLVRPLPAHRGPRLVPTGRQSCATLPSRGSLPLHVHSSQSRHPPHTGEPSPIVPHLTPLRVHRRVAPAPALPPDTPALPRCRFPACRHGGGSPTCRHGGGSPACRHGGGSPVCRHGGGSPVPPPPPTLLPSPRPTSPPCPHHESDRPDPRLWGQPNYLAPLNQQVARSRCPEYPGALLLCLELYSSCNRSCVFIAGWPRGRRAAQPLGGSPSAAPVVVGLPPAAARRRRWRLHRGGCPPVRGAPPAHRRSWPGDGSHAPPPDCHVRL